MDASEHAEMKIYTKTGDKGETGLFGGARVSKDDVRVEAYGAIDELNAALGLACALGALADEVTLIAELQNDLFVVGAELACVPEKRENLKLQLIEQRDVSRLEEHIDRLQAALPPLGNFILPGGTPVAAALHQARTVCRRAERRLLTLSRSQWVSSELLVYLNRLADLCFVMARHAQAARGAQDVAWRARPRPSMEP
jgi:cob(I)alamin adenosyltransferase